MTQHQDDKNFYKPLFARRSHELSCWAIEDLQASLDRHGERWRVPYVASVTLLRSIGHVLKNIDCERDQAVKRAVDTCWPEWKKDEAFGRLEEFRNNALKEFGFPLGRITSFEENTPQDVLLFFEGTPVDALEELQRIWRWWDLRLTEIERKSGRISDEGGFEACRAMGIMRF
ncbi:MAG: hypothetical protein WBP94_13650 [Rhodomicrobiaceae bacterium]